MPTYVYRCENGHTFELFHGISDDTPRPCPECGAESKRVPSGGAGLLFKGSGFYITDYRSKGYKDQTKKEGGAAAEKPTASPGSAPGSSGSGSGAPGTGGSDSKPAKPDGGGAPGGAGSAKPEK
jgi:putative FmdB family regulatory protein